MRLAVAIVKKARHSSYEGRPVWESGNDLRDCGSEQGYHEDSAASPLMIGYQRFRTLFERHMTLVFPFHV
jgi:hypothetical protein